MSSGQFWFGPYGFLYKKNVGVGGRRSTKMMPGGNTTCNTYQYIYNKYTPGQSGIGGQSIAVRRAKNRLSTVCSTAKPRCNPVYNRLGLYNHSYNVNGYDYELSAQLQQEPIQT